VVHLAFGVDCGGVTLYRNKRRDMTIDLNPEQEQLVQQAIRAGLISAADEVVQVGIEAIRDRLEERVTARPAVDAEPWLPVFHAWVHSHSRTTPLLSDEAISRESIYGTRGL
jgi:Arc/MetJ-type ribon-helix-helix transcriptional regulator